MIWLRNLNIRTKLTFILIVTSTTAVLLASIMFCTLIVNYYNKIYRNDLQSLVNVLCYNSQASLAFNISEDAERVLDSLKVRPSVIKALVLDKKGAVFASYLRERQGAAVRSNEDEIPIDILIVKGDIMLNDQVLGTLEVHDDMRHVITTRKLAFATLFPITLIALIFVSFLASRLQKMISGPISDLADASMRISEDQDYTIRVVKQGEDELGHLVDAFNSMLHQIESRDSVLQDNERRYRTLLDQAADAFFLYNTDGKIIDVNQQACQSLGYPQEELLTKSITDIEETRSSAGGSEQENYWSTLIMGTPLTFEGTHHRNDGTAFPVEVRACSLMLGGERFIMSLARDITEREKLQGQLHQAQKMEAIGRLTGGIAHDFNNILTSIIGYSELAQLKIQGNNRVLEYLQNIHQAGLRASELVRQLLAFSRQQVLEMKIIDPNRLINDMIKMLRRIIGEDIQLILHTQTPVGNIKVDPGQFVQIIMNLVVNAKDAMLDGGQLIIETAAIDFIEKSDLHCLEIEPGSYVQICVADTGAGIPKELQKNIFEPFFTTKEKGKGTGLGLSTIYGIVKQHKGCINVYSEVGKGTIFKVYLPAVSAPVDKEPSGDERRVMPRGSETILVVDDESSIRDMILDTLQPLGYQLFAASSGKEALDVSRAVSGRIDLLLTDVIMPEMSGRELVELFHELRPETKIVYMSGYTDEIIDHQGILDETTNFITKPLVPRKLATYLRHVLEQVQQ